MSDTHRRLRGAVIASVVAALLAAAAVVTILLTRDGKQTATPDPAGSQVTPAQEVGHRIAPPGRSPEQVWEWSPEGGGGGFNVVSRGDLIVVGHTDPEPGITRLDADGTPLWTLPGRPVVALTDELNRRIYTIDRWNSPGFSVVDADTGEELWGSDDRTLSYIFDDNSVLGTLTQFDDGGPVGTVHDPDGEELWEREGLVRGVDGHAFVHLGSRVERVEPATGETMWRRRLHVSINPWLKVGTMEVARGLVVVKGRDSAVGVDAEFGKILWRRQNAKQFDYVEPFGTRMVAFSTRHEKPGVYTRAIIASRDGVQRRESYFSSDDFVAYSGVGFTSGDDHYVMSTDQYIYDDSMSAVASFTGSARPAGTGYYWFSGDRFAHHQINGATNWSHTSDAGSDITDVVGLDQRLLVVHDDRVVAYE